MSAPTSTPPIFALAPGETKIIEAFCVLQEKAGQVAEARRRFVTITNKRLVIWYPSGIGEKLFGFRPKKLVVIELAPDAITSAEVEKLIVRLKWQPTGEVGLVCMTKGAAQQVAAAIASLRG